MRISVISVMPETGLVPTMAMALAATVVKKERDDEDDQDRRQRLGPVAAQQSEVEEDEDRDERGDQDREDALFIERSRCVRSAISAEPLPPPNSETARPTA